MKHYLLLATFLFLTACSNLSPMIRNAPKMDLQLEQVQQKPSYYQGSPVRWGGKIIEVNNEDNFSRIQILSYPLNSYGRPQTARKNEGRFVIQSKEFLDPAVYKKEAEITIAGFLKGQIEHTIDKKTLKLPLVMVEEMHLWADYRYQNDFYYSPYSPYYRYRYGYGHRYPFYPYYPTPLLRFRRCD